MRNWILGLAIALFGCGNSGSDDGKLKVGVILPMTGNTATYGEESWNGIQLAMEVLREQGFDCELILKDEKSEKPMAGNQAKLLVENEGVHVLIGSVASSNTEQIALVAKESGVPLITPASTNDGITTKGGPLVSRICFNDSFQGAVLANFAINEGWKKAVAVVDSAQVYSTGLSKNIRKTFEARGGSYVEEFYTTQDTDFSNTISNVANHKPDIIFICGYYNEGGPMIRQAGEKWKGVPIAAGDGFDSPELPKLVGDTNADIYLSSHFAADAPEPAVQEFAKRYEKDKGAPPGAMAGLGYDVMFVLADAVKRCKNPKDPDELAKAIAATRLQGITGMIDLTTPDRTPIKDAVIVKVEGGLKFHRKVPAKK
jgi:branched-chain amino acid transport system substrate-binding protein